MGVAVGDGFVVAVSGCDGVAGFGVEEQFVGHAVDSGVVVGGGVRDSLAGAKRLPPESDLGSAE